MFYATLIARTEHRMRRTTFTTLDIRAAKQAERCPCGSVDVRHQPSRPGEQWWRPKQAPGLLSRNSRR